VSVPFLKLPEAQCMQSVPIEAEASQRHKYFRHFARALLKQVRVAFRRATYIRTIATAAP